MHQLYQDEILHVGEGQWTKITAQNVASYATLVVAMVSLYVSWGQSRITTNQRHADVLPVTQNAMSIKNQ